jgi:hypothetical protein
VSIRIYHKIYYRSEESLDKYDICREIPAPETMELPFETI